MNILIRVVNGKLSSSIFSTEQARSMSSTKLPSCISMMSSVLPFKLMHLYFVSLKKKCILSSNNVHNSVLVIFHKFCLTKNRWNRIGEKSRNFHWTGWQTTVLFVKVNSVQEACAKCFAVDLKSWKSHEKKINKEHQILSF